MKYGYEDIAENILIQNYKTEDNKIVITYLDGSCDEIPLTGKNELDLLNRMLEQAEDRDKSLALFNAYKKRTENFYVLLSDIVATSLAAWVATMGSRSVGEKIICGVLACVTGFGIFVYGDDYRLKSDEIQELEKYHIYLSIKNDLDHRDFFNLFNGVESQQRVLNINTLDDYSLSDIKTMRSNIKRSERYSLWFSDNSRFSIKGKKLKP